MKKWMLACLFVYTLVACSKDEAFMLKPDNYPQKWQLVKMMGQIANSETTGSKMAWQEYYLLNADGTFKKSRDRSGKTTEITGTYSYQDLSDGKYLVLVYETDHELIGTCTAEPKEVLRVTADDTIQSTWWACDGPGLEYKRVE